MPTATDHDPLLNHPSFKIFGWMAASVLAAACAYMAVTRDLKSTLILSGFLVVTLAFLAQGRRLPSLFTALFAASTLMNAAGFVWNLYRRVWFYDELAHFISSFAATLTLGYVLTYGVRRHFVGHGLLFMIITASLGLSLGVLWEFFELVVNLLGSLGDTLTDLAFDAAGALMGGALAAIAMEREQAGLQGAPKPQAELRKMQSTLRTDA